MVVSGCFWLLEVVSCYFWWFAFVPGGSLDVSVGSLLFLAVTRCWFVIVRSYFWWFLVSGVCPWLLWVISGISRLFIVVSDYLWWFVIGFSLGYFWLFYWLLVIFMP